MLRHTIEVKSKLLKLNFYITGNNFNYFSTTFEYHRLCLPTHLLFTYIKNIICLHSEVSLLLHVFSHAKFLLFLRLNFRF